MVEVWAEDEDGSVEFVELLVDGDPHATDSFPPYSFPLDTRAWEVGKRRLTARATDDAGAASLSWATYDLQWGYLPPQETGDGWPVSTLATEGIDSAFIAATMNQLHRYGPKGMHALLVARHGRLVLEEYFGSFKRDSLQHIQSVTKSFTSAMIGIAIDRGEIGSVDDPMVDYLPAYAHLFDEAKAKITIKHCLMMAAGLEWNEHSVPSGDPSNDNWIANGYAQDYVRFVLSKPVTVPPGTQWYYNSGCPMVLGEIIESVSGMSSAYAYLLENLLIPIGIGPGWMGTVNFVQHSATHGGLFLRPRDMARFGQLFLQGGVWQGERIISEDWVRESTTPRLDSYFPRRYGYQWWFRTIQGHDVPFATGYGGQNVFLVPELDLVVVTAADPQCCGAEAGVRDQYIHRMMGWGIIPAVGRGGPAG